MKVALGPLATALVALLPLLASAKPEPRSYDTHAYYALEHPGTIDQARTFASDLNVELVERIGELDGHWLVRSPHTYHASDKRAMASHTEQDPVLRRYAEVKKRNVGRGVELAPLALRKRAKRIAPEAETRSMPHGSAGRYRQRRKRQFNPPTAEPEQEIMEEMLFAQTDLGFKDPILAQQWHLINTRKPEYELNVTKLWARDVTGKGVVVAIIDDGLDMTSDDLAENFVRPSTPGSAGCAD